MQPDYERIRELFCRRFSTGGFRSCDFRPHFDGFAHNAWVAVCPLDSQEATLALAFTRLSEMCEFLRSLQDQFGEDDRIQFAVGFPIAVKPSNRRILKGWIPAARLADVKPPHFAGAIGENDVWAVGLWD